MASEEGHGFFSGMLFGGMVGFLIGVLAAPRSGEEIRAVIGDKTRTIRGQAGNLAGRVRRDLNLGGMDEEDGNGGADRNE
jgi:hypothetical protein